jgi:hypothetical protein
VRLVILLVVGAWVVRGWTVLVLGLRDFARWRRGR